MYGISMAPQTVRSWIHDYTRVAMSATLGMKVGQGTDWAVYVVVLERNRTWWVVKDEETGYVLGSHVGRGDPEGSAQAAVKKSRDSAARRCRRLTYRYVRPNRRWKRGYVSDRSVLDGFRKALRTAALANPLPRLPLGHKMSEGEEAEEEFVKSLEKTARQFNQAKKLDVLQTYLDGWVISYNFLGRQTANQRESPGQESKAKVPFRSWGDVVRYADRRSMSTEGSGT